MLDKVICDILDDITILRREIGELRIRLDEAETRPAEILETLQKLWVEIPEEAGGGEKIA